MTNSTRRLVLAAMGLCIGLALPGPQAAAQDAYPAKPVRFIVSFPPGGSADLMARAVAMKLGEKFGQTFVVENRPGAGGNIGLDLVAKAAPDGYTIGLGAAGALAVNVSLYKTMPFDPVKDFAPVTMLAEIPFVLAANPSVEAKTVAEFVSLAKAKPKALSIGHGGNGTAMHLSSQLLNSMAGVEIELVPYKGSSPAATDTMAGHVPASMLDIPSAVNFIQTKRLTALAVTSSKRVEALADVPTFAESGLPGYESVGWFGVVAPARTPAAIVAKLNAAMVEALKDPDIKQRALSVGAIPASSTPEAFGAMIQSEIAKWGKVIADAGIKPE
jgi:tripartite-type tricarboxylate transporter receptor subunit TctC